MARYNITPAEELHALRAHPQSRTALELPANTTVVVDGIASDTKELIISIDPDPRQAMEGGVMVRCSRDGVEQPVITCVRAQYVLRIAISKSSLDKDTLPRTFAMILQHTATHGKEQMNAVIRSPIVYYL